MVNPDNNLVFFLLLATSHFSSDFIFIYQSGGGGGLDFLSSLYLICTVLWPCDRASLPPSVPAPPLLSRLLKSDH